MFARNFIFIQRANTVRPYISAIHIGADIEIRPSALIKLIDILAYLSLQIFSAYSVTALSAEKIPAPAILLRDILAHFILSL